MPVRPRYALGIAVPGARLAYAARGPSPSGPLRTDDPAFAHSWESPEAVRGWLDSIPANDRDGKPSKHREWMDHVGLSIVPLTTTAGVPIPVDRT